MAKSEVNSVHEETLHNAINGGNLNSLFLLEILTIPTASLVIATFTGMNFISWSRNVRCDLIAMNKKGFMTGLWLMMLPIKII